MATVLERVTKVIVDRLGVDESEVKMEASFRDDLGADSLDVVELVMELKMSSIWKFLMKMLKKSQLLVDAITYIESKLS